MKRLRFFLLFLPVILFQTGCSNANPSPTSGNLDSDGNQVSSVPWNKPESWETQGQLGGMAGATGH